MEVTRSEKNAVHDHDCERRIIVDRRMYIDGATGCRHGFRRERGQGEGENQN